ncbi:MAG: hypothetical protein HY699_04060 [Deltaproteobacteria bacterium]|nr:hypothetical protein [Deltaproteobacteria bacterium]
MQRLLQRVPIAFACGLCLLARVDFAGATTPTPSATPLTPEVNLAPYQPTAWSDEIVVSTQTGTHSDSSSLTSSDTLYLDWAIANLGPGTLPGAAQPTVTLYVDNQYRRLWTYASDVGPGGTLMVNDYQLGRLGGGTHTLTIRIDELDLIAETNERDNEYTKVVALTGPTLPPTPTRTPEPLPNLVPAKPAGWSDKIVISTQSGTHSDSPSFKGTDTLYVDWTIANIGSAPVPLTDVVGVGLYVDGRLARARFLAAYNFTPGAIKSVEDQTIGPLGGGSHTIMIRADMDGDVTETDEGDNEYAKTITLSGPTFSPTLIPTPTPTPSPTPTPPPSGRPNLIPFRPTGWSDAIVVSSATGTSTDSQRLYAGQPLHVDWAVLNNGDATATGSFFVELDLDGTEVASWYSNSPLEPGFYTYVADYELAALAPGTHSLTIKADSTASLAESNEGDNTFTKTITAIAAGPNLIPYQPSGWFDRMVVSVQTGSHSDSPSFKDTDTLYLDWAILNDGTAAAEARFGTALYVDEQLVDSWFTAPPLSSGYYSYVEDYAIGTLPQGTHTLRLKTDSGNAVAEGNEEDNEYAKTIRVGDAAPCPGDCDSGGTVTVDELVRGVTIALGSAALGECPAFDMGLDGSVTVDELVLGVNAALNGCTTLAQQ